MKRLSSLAAVVIFVSSNVFAAGLFDEFTNNISGAVTAVAQKNLDSFAKDLGALLGGGTYHQGKALGLPGFDVGIHVAAKKVNVDNQIVKAAGIDTILLPIVQAEIGLPKKIDLIGRYASYAGATMTGFGLRYGLLKSSLPGFPSVSVQAVYNTLNVAADANKFKAATMSASAVVSFNVPVVNPYIGLGLDSTVIEPDSSVSLPVAGMKGAASGYRAEAGVNLSLIPFTYVQLGGGLVNGETNYTAGLGIKF